MKTLTYSPEEQLWLSAFIVADLRTVVGKHSFTRGLWNFRDVFQNTCSTEYSCATICYEYSSVYRTK